MSKHVHGPFTKDGLVSLIMDLLSAPQEYKMSCKQGITIIKFYPTKDPTKTRWKIQNEIADYLNVPDRKFNRELILKKGK